jgi:hypothetical protein
MKKAIIILSMLFSVGVGIGYAAPLHHTSKPVGHYVYICVSRTAHKYHLDQYCRGLAHCTHTIKKVTVRQAIRMGYTACKICD